MTINDINLKLKELQKNKPKLLVYTSPDGSVYSKPSEVKAVLEWLKQIHKLNDDKREIEKRG